MKLSELKAKGGYLDSSPVKTSVIWSTVFASDAPENVAFDIHVIPDEIPIIAAQSIADDRERMAHIVSKLVLLDDGKETLPMEDALQLDPALLLCLNNAVLKVTAKKKSFQSSMKSGASLFLPELEAGPSEKPSAE